MNPSSFLSARALLLALLAPSLLHAAVVEYDLTIAEQTLSPAGKATSVLTINGGIPGPTLRFREGDTARITVHNHLRENTLLHWHGLLVPNDQDGVPDITTPPIKPGASFTYVFPLKQSGTYWYHSHAGLQEQKGLLGSIVITPRDGESVHADHDYVVLMSDWTNESTNEVLRTLVRGSSYYSVKKGTQQSLLGAIQTGAVREYVDREKARMPAMDISDVAYDAFFINGQRDHHLAGKPGGRIRLRLINGGAASYFFAESSTGDMTVIAADGHPVEPFKIKRLQMGNGETYDVLVTLPGAGSWEVRATASDGSGHASAWIGDGTPHSAPDVPKPDLYRMDAMLMSAMEEDTSKSERPQSPYRQLRAIGSTTLPANASVHTMELRLTGDMQRYIWSFNGKTMNQESMIPVRQGEVLRLELVNDTMMHHPIHLHGFFFRLINGQGERSPLKHTVDVPPMGRQTIEFQAIERGDWMFHCHLLYHMASGMGRLVSVGDGTCNTMMNMGEHGIIPTHLFLDGSVQSHMTEGTLSIMRERDSLNARWQAGLFDSRDAPYEIDLTYDHYFNSNFTAFLGARLTDDREDKNRAIAGIHYRLPYLIDSTLGVDSEGGVRVGIGKTIQLTERLSVFGMVDYDTRTDLEWQAGVEYTLTKQLSLVGQYHSDFGLGAGLGFHF
jgi:FtsP/CotA-like multicopper oxidase with cupredoxin domain